MYLWVGDLGQYNYYQLWLVNKRDGGFLKHIFFCVQNSCAVNGMLCWTGEDWSYPDRMTFFRSDKRYRWANELSTPQKTNDTSKW